MTRATATILGSGTSTGVPVIGCDCAVCTSTDPRNARYRASLMLDCADTGARLVIDTGPEFRLQMLRAGVRRLEHVLYTHVHADHCHGFDDLRAFYFHSKAPVTCHVARLHAAEFEARFRYAFEDTGYVGTKPQVELAVYDEGSLAAGGFALEIAYVPHGPAFRTAAVRSGRFVYATDFKSFPDELVARWRGRIDVMVASGVHFGIHRGHSTIPETVDLFQRLGVRRGIVTHLGHEVDAARDAARLPPGVELAWDGQTVDADVDLISL